MARVFISYKRVDKEKVFKIKDQIESTLGEKCWIDLDGIESDAQFANVIINAIDDCEVVLFMYSKAHTSIKEYAEDWTIRELHYANAKGKRVVIIIRVFQAFVLKIHNSLKINHKTVASLVIY